MNRLRNRFLLLATAGLCLACGSASAFINPNFTPIDLVKQSDEVLLLDLKSVDKDGIVTAAVAKVFKGNTKTKELKLDVMAGTFEHQGKEFISRMNAGVRDAMFFVGKMRVEGLEMDDAGDEPVGFLHYGDQYADWRWVIFRKSEKTWNLEKVDNYLLGTWAGSTDMLARAVDYILTEPSAYIPVAVGAEWKDNIHIGSFKGSHLIRGVDLSGTGKPDLFIASSEGDRLMRFNGKSFEDAGKKLGLASASKAFAWGDIDADGKLDLVSWNGSGLFVFRQTASGSFEKKEVSTGESVSGCVSLAVRGRGKADKPVIVVGRKGMPLLVVPQAGGSWKAQAVCDGKLPEQNLGEGGMCLVADFDGDNSPDIIQLYERGGYFFQGKTDGSFVAPVPTQAGLGAGRSAAAIGDFDGDGLLDIVTVAEDRCRIWHNLGGAKFADLLNLSGEIAYISKANGVDVSVGDVNGDGLQDIFIAYEMLPTQIFFNRGFRSFGHGREMDVHNSLVPDCESGQVSGTLVDINGDGVLDLAVVVSSGEAYVVTGKVPSRPLGVVVSLPPSAATGAPAKVAAWKDKRRLGTWTLNAGDPAAVIGAREAGPLTVQWTLADGKTQKKDVIIRTIPIPLSITP